MVPGRRVPASLGIVIFWCGHPQGLASLTPPGWFPAAPIPLDKLIRFKSPEPKAQGRCWVWWSVILGSDGLEGKGTLF